MFDIDFKGFDKLQKNLKKLERKTRELGAKKSVSFETLFSPSFLSKYTKFSSVDDMLKKSGFTVNNPEDFAAIPDDEWEKFIVENTSFSSWEEMQSKAAEEWMSKELFG